MSTNPQFVKVLLPGLTSQQLGIPPAFWKNINGLSSGNVSLLGPSGSIWPVNLAIKEGHMYFENGWQEFVRDHSLKYGEILLFRYDGNSRFTVLVFDASACERKDCHSVRPCREVVKSKTSKGAKSARQMVPSSPGILKHLDHRKQHAKIKERGNAFEEACSFNSNHPTVVVIMRESYKKRMWLPKQFSKAYLPKNSTEMRLVVPKAGEWSIGVLQCRPGRLILSSGWLKFSESNGLKVGDSLVFELVHKTEMHVHIFRA